MKTKPILFETLRWVAAVAAVILLVVQFGGNTVSSADGQSVADAVTQTLDMTNMQLADNQMVKRLYGLDPSAYESCILYYPNTNMMAEEVLIVKLKDVNQQQVVSTAVQNRLDTQKNTFEGYGVEQFDLLTNYSILEVRGNFVLFVVSSQCDNARNAFLDAL